MKYEGHVSTGMYSYIGFSDAGTPEEAARAYREIEDQMKPQPISDINSKEWTDLYNKVAGGKEINGDPGMLNNLNPLQKFALNEAKKWRKRVSSVSTLT